jgi:hypothetical protein
MSLYTVVLSAFNRAETSEHRKTFGDHSEFPPNFREITEQEFVRMNPFTYSPRKVEFRQMRKERGVPSLCAQLFFFEDGTGYALSADYASQQVQYYRFGCDHKYRELTRAECTKRNIFHPDNGYHVRQCSRCHYLEQFDSGD